MKHIIGAQDQIFITVSCGFSDVGCPVYEKTGLSFWIAARPGQRGHIYHIQILAAILLYEISAISVTVIILFPADSAPLRSVTICWYIFTTIMNMSFRKDLLTLRAWPAWLGTCQSHSYFTTWCLMLVNSSWCQAPGDSLPESFILNWTLEVTVLM
jgi:hypothetical protein